MEIGSVYVLWHTVCLQAANNSPFPKDSVTQEACSCFRQQIFTKYRAKENVSLHKNKVGG